MFARQAPRPQLLRKSVKVLFDRAGAVGAGILSVALSAWLVAVAVAVVSPAVVAPPLPLSPLFPSIGFTQGIFGGLIQDATFIEERRLSIPMHRCKLIHFADSLHHGLVARQTTTPFWRYQSLVIQVDVAPPGE